MFQVNSNQTLIPDGMSINEQESIYISPGLSIQSFFTYICVLSLYLLIFPNKNMFKPNEPIFIKYTDGDLSNFSQVKLFILVYVCVNVTESQHSTALPDSSPGQDTWSRLESN